MQELTKMLALSEQADLLFKILLFMKQANQMGLSHVDGYSVVYKNLCSIRKGVVKEFDRIKYGLERRASEGDEQAEQMIKKWNKTTEYDATAEERALKDLINAVKAIENQ